MARPSAPGSLGRTHAGPAAGWRSRSRSRRSPPVLDLLDRRPQIPIIGRAPDRRRPRISFENVLRQGALLTAALILPTAICMGAAFPLALAIAGGSDASAPRPLRPRLRGQHLRRRVGLARRRLPPHSRVWSPADAGDRQRLSDRRGAHRRRVGRADQPRAQAGVAGTAAAAAVLRSCSARRGIASCSRAASTCTRRSRRRTSISTRCSRPERSSTTRKAPPRRFRSSGSPGTTTLAVDGKVDASNRGDMLTQKLIAHLPLLLHDNPRERRHHRARQRRHARRGARAIRSRAPTSSKSRRKSSRRREFFEQENGKALADPRTHLIVGDGRSHLAADATAIRRHHFRAVESVDCRRRGALHARVLRGARANGWRPAGSSANGPTPTTSATAICARSSRPSRSVFPDGTVWLVGGDDVLLVGGRDADRRSAGRDRANLEAVRTPPPTWPSVAWSIRSRSGRSSSAALASWSATRSGAPLLDDDRMTLEFSAPRELHQRRSGENTAALVALTDGQRSRRRARREEERRRGRVVASRRRCWPGPTSTRWPTTITSAR